MPEEEEKEEEEYRILLNYKILSAPTNSAYVCADNLCKCVYNVRNEQNENIYKVMSAVFLSAVRYCIIIDSAYWLHRRQNYTVIARKKIIGKNITTSTQSLKALLFVYA